MTRKVTCLQVLTQHAHMRQAISLIELGARLQVVQTEVPLSREKLGRLYHEIRGKHAPKGMLPFSLDWFMSPIPNLHASMFYSAYAHMSEHSSNIALDRLIGAYRVYVDQTKTCESAIQDAAPDAFPSDRVLSFTRAWLLVRFFDNRMLQLERCVLCRGAYIVHAHDLHPVYVCHTCRMTPRRAPQTPSSTHIRDKG